MSVTLDSIHECEKCTFVASAEAIFINRELREQISYQPLFLGIFTMPNWSGHSPFYVFQCSFCGSVSVDYPHGYTDFGLLYLKCQNVDCGRNRELSPNKNKTIYELVGGKIPPASRRKRKRDLAQAMAGAGFKPSKDPRVFIKKKNSEISNGSFWGLIARFLRSRFSKSKI